MTPGGMAADDEAAAEPRQLARRAAHLIDDVLDRDLRAQIVARDRHVDAISVQARRDVAEERPIQCLPVAAMDEYDQRALAARGEQVDAMARPWSVAKAPQRLGSRRTVDFRVARAAGDQRAMFGHARAVIVIG